MTNHIKNIVTDSKLETIVNNDGIKLSNNNNSILMDGEVIKGKKTYSYPDDVNEFRKILIAEHIIGG